METPTPETPEKADNATIDASRPFHSVKEAVAIFGKRIFPGEMQPPLKHRSPVVAKITSPSYDEFAASPSSELASPTYELKLTNGKSPSSELTSISRKNPRFVGVENGVLDSSEFTPTSDKPPSFFVENGISSSSEFTKSPNKTALSNAGKEAVNSSVCGPTTTTPSPVNPKIQNISYPTPCFSWESGISAPATPSISSKEIEPSPRHGNPKNDSLGKTVHGNDLVMMLMILKRLESELQETKAELKLLKERESETEVALASLNAELHKNMSKIAKAEAAEAAKAAAKPGTLADDGDNRDTSSQWRNHDVERSNSEVIMKQVDSPTLAQILSITDYDCYFENSNKLKKRMKKKPIIPLITDMFPWPKRSPSSNNHHSAPIFSTH